jgi:hypothetical protein
MPWRVGKIDCQASTDEGWRDRSIGHRGEIESSRTVTG